MALARKQPDDASFKCKAYTAQLPAWKLVQDVYDGIDSIRAKGKTYLPQEEAESDKAYKNRLARAEFFNAYARTVNAFVGMVFRKNPQPGADVPKEMLDHFENIDLMGNHLDTFSKRAFALAVNDGHSFIHVEMSKSVLTDNPQATAADERALNLRPYWIIYNKAQVINWRTAILRNGEVRLTQATICQKKVEAEGEFGEVENTYFRVLRPGSFIVYKLSQGTGKATTLDIVDKGGVSIKDRIPLVPVYTNQTGFFESKPALYDVARLNLKYYRLDSDYDHILHVANVPILCAKGRDEAQRKVTIGPNSLVDVSETGDVKYVEHQGTAISAARTAMQDLKFDMARLGLSLIGPKAEVEQTATEQIFDKAEQDSSLAGMARNLQDALEQCMAFHAELANLATGEADAMKKGGSIKVNQEFIKFNLDAQMILALSNLVASGQMPLDYLWDNLERAGILPEGFDREKAREQILNDGMALTGAGSGVTDPTTDPGNDDPPSGAGKKPAKPETKPKVKKKAAGA